MIVLGRVQYNQLALLPLRRRRHDIFPTFFVRVGFIGMCLGDASRELVGPGESGETGDAKQIGCQGKEKVGFLVQ